MSLHRGIRSCFQGLLTVTNRRGFRFSASKFLADKNVSPASIAPKSTVITPTPQKDEIKSETGESRFVGQPRRAPTAMDRYFLVWSGQYKNRDEIPAQLEQYQIIKAREWGRIRVNIYILILAAGLSVAAVFAGKRAAKRGESVEGANLAWHKQINEEYRKEQELAKAKDATK